MLCLLLLFFSSYPVNDIEQANKEYHNKIVLYTSILKSKIQNISIELHFRATP